MATHAPITSAPSRASLPDIRKLYVNGTIPFSTGADITDNALSSAHALLIWLSNANDDAQELYRHRHKDGHAESMFESTMSTIKSQAFSGLATLVALAQYGQEISVAEKHGG